jgi:hypothetical protein
MPRAYFALPDENPSAGYQGNSHRFSKRVLEGLRRENENPLRNTGAVCIYASAGKTAAGHCGKTDDLPRL